MLAYLLGHDLVNQILLLTSAAEPFADAIDEPVHIQEPPGAWFGQMLRLVDVQRAIEARPALPQASGESVTIALSDVSAPWNAGTWHIECSEGRFSCEKTDATPDADMDVGALASIYNGFTNPADAARVGTIQARQPRAIDALGNIFSVRFAPYCPDDF